MPKSKYIVLPIHKKIVLSNADLLPLSQTYIHFKISGFTVCCYAVHLD